MINENGVKSIGESFSQLPTTLYTLYLDLR
jgi:hypothetical protein